MYFDAAVVPPVKDGERRLGLERAGSSPGTTTSKVRQTPWNVACGACANEVALTPAATASTTSEDDANAMIRVLI